MGKKQKHSKTTYYAMMPIVFIVILLIIFLIRGLSIGFNNLWLMFAIIVSFAVLIIYIKKVYEYLLKIERYILNVTKEGDQSDSNEEVEELLEPFGDLFIESIRRPLEREYAALICKKQAEVNALQSQINPHFLYNTLDSIRGHAVMEHADGVSEMIEALANFIRYNIGRSGNMVTLADEINNIDTYIKIQHFRFGDRFDAVKEFEGDNYQEILIPKLTLQPIVENAIFHGIERSERKGIITIRITITDKRILLCVSDNGLGMSKEKLKELNDKLSSPLQLKETNEAGTSHGIAIKNVSDRIKLCFGEEYGLVIYSAPNFGTDVEIRMPLTKDGE